MTLTLGHLELKRAVPHENVIPAVGNSISRNDHTRLNNKRLALRERHTPTEDKDRKNAELHEAKSINPFKESDRKRHGLRPRQRDMEFHYPERSGLGIRWDGNGFMVLRAHRGGSVSWLHLDRAGHVG